MNKLSLQWRLTLTTAFVISISCLILTLIISSSATVRLDQLENYIVNIGNMDEESFQIGIDAEMLLGDVPDLVASMKYHFRVQSFFFMLLVILGASLFIYFFSGKMLSPLRTLHQKMQETNEQNLCDPLPVPATHDEVAKLPQSFNEMLHRLDTVFTFQKNFTANAAHELRTPLAVIQTKLEVFEKTATHPTADYDQLLTAVKGYVGKLSSLVNTLLEMSNLQTVPMTDTIALNEVLDEILWDLSDPAEQRNISLSLTAAEGTIVGNDTLIYRLFYNLIENAIKYNTDGGSVSVTESVSENALTVTIADTGIGIPQDTLAHIFEPFYRADASRSEREGFGLGLAIVKAIVEQHKGTIQVSAEETGGTTITVTLPRC